MGIKTANTTSKIRICDAVLNGLLRKDLRLVGYWLVANQSHQIEYHRQKIHSFKTRIGGESALEELLQCVSMLTSVVDDATTDQHGSKPAGLLDAVPSEEIISSDWIAAFSGITCTEEPSTVLHQQIIRQPSVQRSSALPPIPSAPPRMSYVAQSLSDQLMTFEHNNCANVIELQETGSQLALPSSEILDHSEILNNSQIMGSSEILNDHAENVLQNYEFLSEMNSEPNFDGNLLIPHKGSLNNSVVTETSDQVSLQPTVESRIESLELPGGDQSDLANQNYHKWTEEMVIGAAEMIMRKPLSKEHQDLLSYVVNMGTELERKCLDVVDAVRIWNSWSDENLHLVPIRTNDPPNKPFTFRPPLKHDFAGWKIHLEDRPRQRYTKRTVQKWMTYMSSLTMGVWHSGITAKNFREALENGGLFCTIGGTRQEDLAYNILGGRRNHVTKVEALNIRCGQYEKEYEFKRYDTDLILPEYILKNPLPRVVVFESQELNLRAVMFIVRHPLEKGTNRRPAKRTKKFDTLLGGELRIDQIDGSTSTACLEQSSSLPSSDLQLQDELPPTTSFCPEIEENPLIDGDELYPKMKVEQLDEADLYCVSHHIASEAQCPQISQVTLESEEREGDSSGGQPEGTRNTELVTYESDPKVTAWEAAAGFAAPSREIPTSVFDWSTVDAPHTRVLQRSFNNAWYADGSTEEIFEHQSESLHNAFEDAIFATTQQVKRSRTSKVQY